MPTFDNADVRLNIAPIVSAYAWPSFSFTVASLYKSSLLAANASITFLLEFSFISSTQKSFISANESALVMSYTRMIITASL